MPQEVRLRQLPGERVCAEDFELVDVALPDLLPGEVLVRNQWMSIDPYMRLVLAAQKGFVTLKQPGDLLDGAAIGVVERSAHPDFPEGAIVQSDRGWRSHFIAPAAGLSSVRTGKASPSWHFGVLGLTGMSAWIGVEQVLKPVAGETILVSGASGAVGSIAVQLAKLRGARVLASCGSDEKAALLRDQIGVDAVMNYRKETLADFLGEEAPDGLDGYFDNVGGGMLDAVLGYMKPYGRVGLCGAISQYESGNYRAGPRDFFSVIEKSLRLQGFNAFLVPEAEASDIIRQLEVLALDGRINVLETVIDGLENAGSAFAGLFSGEHTGKVVVRI